MLVFRPQEVFARYKGYVISIESEDSIEDTQLFNEAVNEVKRIWEKGLNERKESVNP